MKEFIDKLISRLNEEMPMYASGWRKDMNNIVNKLAEEYKGKKVNSDLISRSETIKELNEIYLDNSWDDKEDILEKAIGIVEHINCSINASTDCSTKVSEMPTGWISVSERLPELTEGTECFKQSKCCLVALKWWDGDITESVAWYNQSGVWNEDSKNCKVIAWMPLPAPFKEGE